MVTTRRFTQLSKSDKPLLPKYFKNATNKKGNLEYKLDTLAPLNGVDHT